VKLFAAMRMSAFDAVDGSSTEVPSGLGAVKAPRFGGGAKMQTITTVGLDIAKSVFQIHGVDASGNVVVRRRLKRRYVLPFFQKLSPCLVGIEACASSHHWSRQLQAVGHTVRLMPPAYVKPYVKRHKAATSRSPPRRSTAQTGRARAETVRAQHVVPCWAFLSS
jgi:hypothetical protein